MLVKLENIDNRPLKKTLIILTLIFFAANSFAQKFIYDVDFLSYFDNRESSISYYRPQTLFGLRLSPEVGVDFIDDKDGRHRLMAGVSYIQPFGLTWRSINVKPTAYYMYNYKGFKVSMGAIPYRNLIKPLPQFFMSDEIKYITPNMYGALFSYQSKLGYVEFFCDWRAMPSNFIREAFKIHLSGRYDYKALFVGGYVQLNHLANRAATQPSEGVCDDFTINPYIGGDFSHLLPIDSLSIKVNYIAGLQRNRRVDETYLPQGVSLELFFKWKWIGIENMFYIGDNQFPLYSNLDSELNQGEALFANNIYNRTSVFFTIIKRDFVDLSFYYKLHYVKGYDLAHQQQLMVKFNLDALMKYKRGVIKTP